VIRVVAFDRLTEYQQLHTPEERVRRIPVRPTVPVSLGRPGRPLENEPASFRVRSAVAFRSRRRHDSETHIVALWDDLPRPFADLATALFMVGTLGRLDGVEVVELALDDNEILGVLLLATIEGPTGMPRWRSPTVEDKEIERLIRHHTEEHATAVYVREVCR